MHPPSRHASPLLPEVVGDRREPPWRSRPGRRAADRHSPRAVYELPDPELAGPPYARMAERVRASRQVLKEALAGLSDDDLARTSWVKCRGW